MLEPNAFKDHTCMVFFLFIYNLFKKVMESNNLLILLRQEDNFHQYQILDDY